MKKNSFKSNLYCIYPTWISNSGHEISYLDSLKLLSKKISKKLYLIIPKKNKNVFLNICNIKNLEHISTGHISTFLKILKNYNIMKNFFIKKNLTMHDTIFMDGYSFDFLISLVISLNSFNKCGSFLVYCRYDYKNIKRLLFKIFIFFINRKFKNFIILTDTSDLKKKLVKIYKKKVLLLPVPHTHEKTLKNKKIKSEKVNLFFPGPIREEKFGDNFYNFLKKNNNSLFKIFISKDFSWKTNFLFDIKYLNNNLDRKDYLKYFINSQIVVLPYSYRLYKDRTSGIFIEGIVMRKIVLVTNGTWMAKELKKFKLNELIVNNWKYYLLEENINRLFSHEVKKKIDKMKNYYVKIHNKNNYTNLIKTNL